MNDTMKIIVFCDGSTRAITGDQGKYWLTGEDRVRKLSRQIAEIREVPDTVKIKLTAQAPAELGAEVGTAKPKKKSSRKKKEVTEVKGDGERGE